MADLSMPMYERNDPNEHHDRDVCSTRFQSEVAAVPPIKDLRI